MLLGCVTNLPVSLCWPPASKPLLPQLGISIRIFLCEPCSLRSRTMDPPGLEAREESSSEAEGEDNMDTSISLDERLLQVKNNLQWKKLELKHLQKSRDRICKNPIGTLIDQPRKSTLTSTEQNSCGYVEHIFILQELLTPDDQQRINEEGESDKIQWTSRLWADARTSTRPFWR